MCDVCKKDVIILGDNIRDDLYVSVEKDKLKIDYECSDGWYSLFETFPIKFCPWCGEKL